MENMDTMMEDEECCKISCKNVPKIFFEDKHIAKDYFHQYGKIKRLIFKPKYNTCIVEYIHPNSVTLAIENGGVFEDHEFEIFIEKSNNQEKIIQVESPVSIESVDENAEVKEQKISKKKPAKNLDKIIHEKNMKDKDPNWLDDPEVKAELEAMGGNKMITPKKYNLRPELMSIDSPIKNKPEKVRKTKHQVRVPAKIKSTPKNTKTTLSADQLELINIIKEKAMNADDKYKILDARDKLIRFFLKKKNVRKTGPTVGTCPDMCPEKERLMRVTQHQVALYEQEEDGKEMDPSLAIKQYSRSSADQESPLPHELRPVSVLEMTMGYLVHKIMDLCDKPDVNLGEWYHFLWDRSRGIRKDITQQELCCQGSVKLVEQCARFHIHCSARLIAEDPSTFDQRINTENLTKCLQTLKYMYNDLHLKGESCPNEAEFRAYIILLNLNDGNFMWEVQKLQRAIQKSKEIKFALEVYSSLDKNNFIKFFKLVNSTTYLNSCILMRYFVQVRMKAVGILLKCYSSRLTKCEYPLGELTSNLAFEDSMQAIDFFEYCGLYLNTSNSHIVLDKQLFTLPQFQYLLERSRHVIESKRTCSVGEVICGGNLPQKLFEYHLLQSSFDNGGFLKLYEYLNKDDINIENQIAVMISDQNKVPDQPFSTLDQPQQIKGGDSNSTHIFTKSTKKKEKGDMFESKTRIPHTSSSKEKQTKPKQMESIFGPSTTTSPNISCKAPSPSSIFEKSKPVQLQITDGGSNESMSVSQKQPDLRSDELISIFGKPAIPNENSLQNTNIFGKSSIAGFVSHKQDIWSDGVRNENSQEKSIFGGPPIQQATNIFSKVMDNVAIKQSIFDAPREFDSQKTKLTGNNFQGVAKPVAIFGTLASQDLSHPKPSPSMEPTNVFGNKSVETKSSIFGNATVFNPEKIIGNDEIDSFNSSQIRKSFWPTSDRNSIEVSEKGSVENNIESIFFGVPTKSDLPKPSSGFSFTQKPLLPVPMPNFSKQETFEDHVVDKVDQNHENLKAELLKQEIIEQQHEQRLAEEQRRQKIVEEQRNKKIVEDRLRKLGEEKLRLVKKEQELVRKIVEENRKKELARLKQLEIENAVQALLPEILLKVERNVQLSKLKELQEKILNRKLYENFNKWHSITVRNKRKRKAIDCSPVWVCARSPQEEAKELKNASQDLTLKYMKRYKDGSPISVNCSFNQRIQNIQFGNILNVLVRRYCELDLKYFKTIFWKVSICLPNSSEMHYGLTRIEDILKHFLQWKEDEGRTRLLEEYKFNQIQSATYCIEKQNGCDVHKFDSNGLIFVANNFNKNLCKRILKNLKGYGIFVKVPIVIILQEKPSNVTSLKSLIDKEIISDYIILVDNFSSKNFINLVERGLIFLASNVEKPPPLQMESLRAFLLKNLGNEIWKKATSFCKWNSNYKNCLKDPNIVIQLYNTALDKLKTIILNKACFEFAMFPEVFEKFLLNKLPDSLPCDYKYFPKFYKDKSYYNRLSNILNNLKLTEMQNWPPSNSSELEVTVKNYCTEIYSKPDRPFHKIMAVLLKCIEVNEDFESIKNVIWSSVMELIAQEKINSINFSLNATKFSDNSVYDQFVIVYDPVALEEFCKSDWYYVTNPIFKNHFKKYDFLNETTNKEVYHEIPEDIDSIILEAREKLKTPEHVQDIKANFEKFTMLMMDLENSFKIHKTISSKFDDRLKEIIKNE